MGRFLYDTPRLQALRRQYEELGRSGVLAFLALNLGIRLWFFFSSGLAWSATTTMDEQSYLAIAADLAAQGPRWLFTAPAVQAAPGHVVFLWLCGNSVGLAKLFSLAASTATLLPIVSIARRVLPGRGVFWSSVAFTACHPLVAFTLDSFATTILTEAINAFLVTSAIALLLRAFDRPSATPALVSGLCLGLATLWRATTLLYPLALALLLTAAWAIPFVRRRLAFEVPRALKTTAWHALGLLLAVGPFLVKNGIAFGQWKLATGTGAVLYLGADPKTEGGEPYFAGYNFDTAEVSTPYTHIQPEGDAQLVAAALRQIKRDPLGFVALRIRWPVRLFVGEPADAFNPVKSIPQAWAVRKANATLLMVWGLCWRAVAIAFAVLFFVRAWRSREGFVLASVPLYFLVMLLPLFVVSRYAVPLLPLLAVPMVGGLSMRTAWRVPAGAVSAALIVGVGFWHELFPDHVDPADYAHHTELARWPAWESTYAFAEGPTREGVQVFESMAAAPSLGVEARGIPLELNQILLFPIRLAPRPAGWPLHAYWQSAQAPGFSEERTTDDFLPANEHVARFVLPVRAGDTLSGFRVDFDLPPGARARIGPGPGPSWACSFGCSASPGPSGDAEIVGTEGPEAIATSVSQPMDAAVRVEVPIVLPPVQPVDRTGQTVQLLLRWQIEGDPTFGPAELRVLEAPVDGRVHWLRLNPSLFPAGARWSGTLGRISLQLANGHDLEVEVGPLRLLKDYRMLR